jgi:hypothetical protein
MNDCDLPGRALLSRFGSIGVRVCVAGTLSIVGVCGAAGCAKAQAKTTPDGPPLEMPAPPPRVLAPVDEPAATLPSEPTEPAPTPPNANRRTIPRRTTTEPAQKPDTLPAEPAPPAPTTTEPNRPPEPQPTLRAPGAAEKPIRDRIAFAQRDLGRVDYAKLSEDGRSQYEQSKRFIQQAEQALKDQNFVFAQTLADKAAVLAAELLGR